MKSISGKDFCKILEKKGWLLKTIKESHHVYMKYGKKRVIIKGFEKKITSQIYRAQV
jgi:YcfA-like protein.